MLSVIGICRTRCSIWSNDVPGKLSARCLRSTPSRDASVRASRWTLRVEHRAQRARSSTWRAADNTAHRTARDEDGHQRGSIKPGRQRCGAGTTRILRNNAGHPRPLVGFRGPLPRRIAHPAAEPRPLAGALRQRPSFERSLQASFRSSPGDHEPGAEVAPATRKPNRRWRASGAHRRNWGADAVLADLRQSSSAVVRRIPVLPSFSAIALSPKIALQPPRVLSPSMPSTAQVAQVEEQGHALYGDRT